MAERAAPEPTADEPAGEPVEAAAGGLVPGAAVDDRDRPPVQPAARKRDPIWAWSLVALGTVLVLLASGLVAAEQFILNRYQHVIKQETLLAPEARAAPGPEQRRLTLSGPLNYLLLGSDARSDDPANGQRSDTIIVLHIPASMDRAFLVSIPRDLRVHIPAFGPTRFHGAYEKINGALQYGGGGVGGIQLLSQTLTNLLGIQFDGAAVIDFAGFSSVVDHLGGVDMCVDVRTESIHIGYDRNGKFLAPRSGPEAAYRNPASTPKVYEPGCRHFEGWEALDYVRQRKTLPNGDYDRQRHQQQFLRAVVERVKTNGWMTNPIELDGVLRTVGGSLTIDTNGVPLADLAYALRGVAAGTLAGVTVPSEPAMIGGISYITPLSESQSLYEALRVDTMDAWVAGHPSWTNAM